VEDGYRWQKKRRRRFLMRFAFVALSTLYLASCEAWTAPNNFSRIRSYTNNLCIPNPLEINSKQIRPAPLFSTSANDALDSVHFSEAESNIVEEIWDQSGGDAATLKDLTQTSLATMHPTLVLKLRQHSEMGSKESVSDAINGVAEALSSILNSRLEGARDVLANLLECGEIRKLDAAIGKAAREGKLDMAFFTVLNMNLQDAAEQEPKEQTNDEDKSANRYSILQHIYTRCQEEVEKNVAPGMALLNKLLRTEVDSIRKNQLEHYLCPQKNVIKSPDGKEIKLEGVQQVLVPPSDFIGALEQAVKQIRTVEKAGGTDPATAAGMVESCRQVAKEARIVIGTAYGVDSEELMDFEAKLMPVFRPSTPESPYIKGE